MSDPNYADWQIPMFRGLIVRWHQAKTDKKFPEAALVEQTLNSLRLLYPEAYDLTYKKVFASKKRKKP